MNVYFVNCLLACTIAYGVGFWSGKRTENRRLASILSYLASGRVSMATVGESVNENVTKH
jgi:hypothetical protein